MERIGIWGISVCVFSVIIVLFKAMFPQGNIKKTGETVMVLLMLLVMLQPFTKMNLNSDVLIPPITWYDYAEIQEKSAYDTALQQVILEMLLKNNIHADEIQLQTEIDHEQYLVLTALKIKTEADTEEIYLYLEELGIPREIVEIGV